jgi:hypothetical protein
VRDDHTNKCTCLSGRRPCTVARCA